MVTVVCSMLKVDIERTLVAAEPAEFLSSFPGHCARAARLGVLNTDVAPSGTQAAVRRDPTNVQMIRFLARQARRSIQQPVRSLLAGQRWQVGLVERRDGEEGEVPDLEGTAIRWIDDGIDHGYLADPFPHRRHGKFATLVSRYSSL